MAVPYYNVGTATLTTGSAAMVGQGTLWVGNVRPGDQVVSYTGETAIVGTVVDNTHITLAREFRGTSQTAAVYEIVYTPDDPYTQTLARQVLQAVSGSALVGLGSVTPAARKLPYFDATATAALTDLSDFALTLLDNTSAAALLTALGLNVAGQSDATLRIRKAGNAIEFGHGNPAGYGSTLGAEVGNGNSFLLFFGEAGSANNTYRTRGASGIGLRGRKSDGGLDFIRIANPNADNQDPTVVASLDPDGSLRQAGVKIIEQGSNATGRYTKFVDGTMICLQTVTISMNTNSFQSFTYPAEFVSREVGLSLGFNNVAASGVNSNWWGKVYGLRAYMALTTTCTVLYSGDFAPQAVTGLATIQSVGRWK